MRPTGRLHIGHYFGALQNWVKLQSDPTYECFYFVADWHALTSDYADTSAIAENSLQITIDFLASGLDPAKSTIFLQSQVPEHAELHLLLSMVTPLGWLERIPTYKEQLDQIKNTDLHTYGFLGYPTLQTADIVLYSEPSSPAVAGSPAKAGKGLLVPVGEDQVSHVEFSRELVRRFNFWYGFRVDPSLFDKGNEEWLGFVRAKLSLQPMDKQSGPRILVGELAVLEVIAKQYAQNVGFDNFLQEMGPAGRFFICDSVLVEPGHLLTPTPRIPGLDGRKMSKSYNNAITLSESDDDIRKKTKVMVTDPARKRRTDPGNPDICPVYDWHKLFSTPERDPGRLDWVRKGCTTAGIGCIECKSAMAENLIKWIAPVREKRLDYEAHPKKALEILDAGSAKAREFAKQTIERVRNAIFNWPRKRAEISG
jgi:tryptophanyl-tRNA synthetase